MARPSRAERRHEQEEFVRPVAGNERPHEPTRINEANRCPAALGRDHNCSMHTKGPEGFQDERGSRVVRCWYCCALSRFSANRIAKWEQEKEGRIHGHTEGR